MTIAGVTRELLVRYLDVWTPAALRSAKRVTFAYAWSAPGTAEDSHTGTKNTNGDSTEPHAATAEAALRGFAEFDDLLRARKLTYIVVGPDGDIGRHLEGVQAELRTPANLTVHVLDGQPEQLLTSAMTAAGSGGAPLLVCSTSPRPSRGCTVPVDRSSKSPSCRRAIGSGSEIRCTPTDSR